MPGEFIVAVKLTKYLVRFDAAQPMLTETPSYAMHMSYRAADRVSLNLRAKGFGEAHVCTIDGMPATLSTISEAQDAAEEYQVTFGGKFHFAGPNRNNEPLGSRDSAKAVNVSHAVAVEICARLKRMGFSDAEVVESPAVSAFEEELNRVWGPNPNPPMMHFKK